MVTITLYAKQKEREIDTEQTFILCGRRRGWDVLREQHWNKYTIKGETDLQSRLDAWDMLRPGALGVPRGIRWRGRWEGGSGWGTHVNPWLIHVSVWQKPLQYYKVISLQLIKTNGKKKLFWKKMLSIMTKLKYLGINPELMSSVVNTSSHHFD